MTEAATQSVTDSKPRYKRDPAKQREHNRKYQAKLRNARAIQLQAEQAALTAGRQILPNYGENGLLPSDSSLADTDREVMASCLQILRDASTSTSDRLKAITTYSQLRSRLAASLERSTALPSATEGNLPPLSELSCKSRFTVTDDYSGFRGFGGAEDNDNANG